MMAAGAYRFTVAQAGLIHTASNLELILFLYDNLMLSPSLLSPVARCDKCGCFVYESKQYRIVSISVIDTYLSNALHTQSSPSNAASLLSRSVHADRNTIMSR